MSAADDKTAAQAPATRRGGDWDYPHPDGARVGRDLLVHLGAYAGIAAVLALLILIRA